MALCRRVLVAESPGTSFRERSRIPIPFGLSFIHGKLRLENSGLVKNTPLAAPFSTGPGKRRLMKSSVWASFGHMVGNPEIPDRTMATAFTDPSAQLDFQACRHVGKMMQDNVEVSIGTIERALERLLIRHPLNEGRSARQSRELQV
jgi:hypothetical protein